MSKDNKEVDVFAQIVGMKAISNPQYMFDYVDSINKGRKILRDYFEEKKIKYLAGKGNYMLFKVNDPSFVEKGLKTNNIFVRNRTHVENLEGYLRVTLGDIKTMNRFVEVLNNIHFD